MIKSFKNYLFEYTDIDPYGEENWNDESQTDIFADKLRRYGFITILHKIEGLIEFSMDYPNRGIVYLSIWEDNGEYFLESDESPLVQHREILISKDDNLWDKITYVIEGI